MLGGYDQNGNQISAVDAYDPAANSWTTVTNLPAPGVHFAATVGTDGRIYVLGGYDVNFNISSQAEAYDPASNTWTTLSNLSSRRWAWPPRLCRTAEFSLWAAIVPLPVS